MANSKNLRKLTTEEAREIGRKGGLASGKARKERKTLKEELLLLLEDEKTQKELSVALIKRAKLFDNMGNKAYEIIRGTIGEKPTDKLEFTQDKPFEVKIEVIK